MTGHTQYIERSVRFVHLSVRMTCKVQATLMPDRVSFSLLMQKMIFMQKKVSPVVHSSSPVQ